MLKDFNKSVTYFQKLKRVIKEINTIVDNDIDLLNEVNKLFDYEYNVLENLFNIYEVIPFKVDLSSTSMDSVFNLHNPTDNLFQDSLNCDYLLSGVEGIKEKFSELFYFLYFFRNIYIHYKHNVKIHGHSGSERGVNSIRIGLTITKEVHSYKYFEKNSSWLSFEFSDNLILVKEDNYWELEYWLDLISLKEITSEISRSFILGLEKLFEYVVSHTEKSFGEKYAFTQESASNVIESWLERLSE